MIEIIGNKGCTVHYKCSCGVRGKCMIKPLEAEDYELKENLDA